MHASSIMLFDTYLYVLFFSIVLVVYYRLGMRAQNWFLLAASIVFYAAWNVKFLALIGVSTGVDFFAGRYLDTTNQPAKRKLALAASLASNLAILATFKYFNFFSTSIHALLTAVGLETSLYTLEIILPVGISFHTFQGMSYVIDVYRRQTPAVRSLLSYYLYICFFPQLVAGPIERASRLIPQFESPRRVDHEAITLGILYLLDGYIKKLVIADNLAPIANYFFSLNTRSLTAPEALIGMYCFAFQIYGDFAGYSSIAKGSAKLLGFDISLNFNNPYTALNLRDFWRRWHISLSQFLRDYLYVSLGGNRKSLARTALNLLTTMALGGLWHGAAWTFVVWGIYHGALLGLDHARTGAKLFLPDGAIGRSIARLTTFHLVCIGWVFFRATSFDHAIGYLVALTRFGSVTPVAATGVGLLSLFALPLFAFELLRGDGELERVRGYSMGWRVALTGGVALGLFLFASPARHVFIYFAF